MSFTPVSLPIRYLSLHATLGLGYVMCYVMQFSQNYMFTIIYFYLFFLFRLVHTSRTRSEHVLYNKCAHFVHDVRTLRTRSAHDSYMYTCVKRQAPLLLHLVLWWHFEVSFLFWDKLFSSSCMQGKPVPAEFWHSFFCKQIIEHTLKCWKGLGTAWF